MRIQKQTFLASLIILSVTASDIYSRQVNFGIISAIKNKVNELKEKKSEQKQSLVISKIGYDGGVIQLPDGTFVSFPENFLNSDTDITLRKFNSPLTPVNGAHIMSPSYRLEIPIDSISSNNNVESSLNIEIPINNANNANSSIKGAPAQSDAYDAIRLNINGIPTLYGNYTISNNKAVSEIPLTYFMTAKDNLKHQGTIITTDYEALSYRDIFE